MIRVKICGVTTPHDAAMVAGAGADAIGLNFYDRSPRFIQPANASDIIRILSPFVAPVGVFVNTPITRATAIAFQLGLRAIQTVNDKPETGNSFPFAHIATFRVSEVGQLPVIRKYVEKDKPAAVLIDSHVPGQMGGTGMTAPWQLLAGFDPGVPLILAGGLTPANVAEAIRIVKPWGVDVASGVESSPGVKDPVKVSEFLAAVHSVV